MSAKKVHFHYKPDNKRANNWVQKLTAELGERIEVDDTNPELVIALGGDGTILGAARDYQSVGAHILGLNLGTIGFLAVVQEEDQFIAQTKKAVAGEYNVSKRVMNLVKVFRDEETVFEDVALNDAVISSPLSVVELDVLINNDLYQRVRGSGVLVASPTGSTAYNLSAHGPIVMPTVDALVVTELLDTGLPTPSLVVDSQSVVRVKIGKYGKPGQLKIAATNQPADIVLDIDGANLFSLENGDVVEVCKCGKTSLMIEFEKNHFFRFLNERFSIK